LTFVSIEHGESCRSTLAGFPFFCGGKSMAAFQKTPSLGSIPGLIAMIAGVAISIYVLSQFAMTRRLLGLSIPGQLPTA